MENLVFSINTSIQRAVKGNEWIVRKYPMATLNAYTGRLRFTSGLIEDNGREKDIIFQFTQEVMESLGFTRRTWILNPRESTDYYLDASNELDYHDGIWSLYVYSNIAKLAVVGNEYANLLRTVEIPPRSLPFGEPFTVKYNSPHYVPLAANEFESIEIDIKNDQGETIPFQSGRTVVKLHFRKIE